MLNKRDTAGGFAPAIPLDPSVTVPSRNALRMDGRVDALALSPALHRLMLTMARIRNVYSSLRIEGIPLELNEARDVVETGRAETTPQKMALRFAREYATIHETRPSRLPDLDAGLILDLHRRLLHDDPEIHPDHLGRFKPVQNYVVDKSTGQAIFAPTPPERVEAELDALLTWFTEQENRLPPAVVAAVFFAELQCIHPFTDGNGRIGRILNLIVLKRLGFINIDVTPLDGLFFESQDRYYEKLRATNQGAWHVWTRYFCDRLERAYTIATQRGDLRPLLDEQGGHVAKDFLEWILTGDGGWFKRGDYPNPNGHSGAALTNVLATLGKKGILEYRGERRGREHRLSTEFLKRLYGGNALQG